VTTEKLARFMNSDVDMDTMLSVLASCVLVVIGYAAVLACLYLLLRCAERAVELWGQRTKHAKGGPRWVVERRWK
jgi:hypothetical protein